MDNYFDDLKLKIDGKPEEFHFKTVRKSIPQSLWTKIRKKVLETIIMNVQYADINQNKVK